MRKHIIGVVALVGTIAAGAVIGFLRPISPDGRATFCAALAGSSKWLEGQCPRSEEIEEMLKRVELFCTGHADYQRCLESQALVRIVRIGEDRPLETNRKLPKCIESTRNALGRADFIKASSCLEAENPR